MNSECIHKYQTMTGARVFLLKHYELSYVAHSLTEQRRSSWCRNCAMSSAVVPSIPCSCRYCIPLFGFLLNLFTKTGKKVIHTIENIPANNVLVLKSCSKPNTNLQFCLFQSYEKDKEQHMSCITQ